MNTNVQITTVVVACESSDSYRVWYDVARFERLAKSVGGKTMTTIYLLFAILGTIIPHLFFGRFNLGPSIAPEMDVANLHEP